MLSLPKLKSWLHAFIPSPILISRREKALSCLGALLGLFLCERISSFILGVEGLWFIAPMGASAVLLFGVPSSPLAQPWSIIGGNTVAAFIGVSCSLFIPERALAAGAAVGLAIGVMFYLRCLHPPSGAVALTAVLGGPAINKLGYLFVIYPVALNSLLLLGVALIFNGLAKRHYPQRHLAPSKAEEHMGFFQEDLEMALIEHGELLDISMEDLVDLLDHAAVFAGKRRSNAKKNPK